LNRGIDQEQSMKELLAYHEIELNTLRQLNRGFSDQYPASTWRLSAASEMPTCLIASRLDGLAANLAWARKLAPLSSKHLLLGCTPVFTYASQRL
jgi:hypothetical protein